MSTQTPYTRKLYTPEEIRLVRVFAGQWRDPIRCMLIRRRLHDASAQPPYKALSYVWGSSSVTDTIDLQELPFKITLNLSCALRHLRKVDGEIFLWVDALCINQQDHKERSLQVSIMRLIYKNAEQVLVFMGDSRAHRVNRSHLKKPHISPMTTLHGHEQNKLFLSNMWSECHSIGSRRVASSLPAATCAIGLIALFSDQETVEEGCKELMRLSERNRCDLFEHLKAFVTCPWWSRIWVVQEIAVGTVVTIQYGTITVPWETLVETAKVWSSVETRQVANSAGIEPENLRVFARFANQLTGLEQTRRKWHAEGGTDLVRLLQEFSDRQASDDRDKVYGLLSLAKRGQKFIRPNYQLEVFGTYRATALALIGKGKSLACWAGDQKRKFNRGLPSWIPDWSTAVENGDKRRMDLFDKYAANDGWTLRFIEDELQYWITVEAQMALLMNSPACKAGRLPASLNPFMLDYFRLLKQRARSLLYYRHDACISEQAGMNHLTWDWSRGITPQSTLNNLEWCESHGVVPRSGINLLRRWINELREYQSEVAVEQVRDQESEQGDRFVMNIHQHLQKIGAAAKAEDFVLEHQELSAQFSIYKIESTMFGTENHPGTRISFAMESVMQQCLRLSSLCKATDNAISPNNLFRISYALQRDTLWLTESQFISERGNAREREIEHSPGIEHLIRERLIREPPIPEPPIPEHILTIQMVLVDSVSICGPKQFGWADTKSALITLIFWLYLSGSVIADGIAENREAQLDHARIRKFARTIMGGMCRCGDSYHKADEVALCTLEDWLRQSLVVVGEGLDAWGRPDQDDDNFGQLKDWIRSEARFNPGHDTVVPPEEWLRKALAARDITVPPSPFFEDIQVATEGRVFFLTNDGSMGLGPASVREGDSISILPSGHSHFVLRRKPSGSKLPDSTYPEWIRNMQNNQHELIGDCYLHTDDVLDNQILVPAEEEPVIEGSLPFEILGAKYCEERKLPLRRTIMLI